MIRHSFNLIRRGGGGRVGNGIIKRIGKNITGIIGKKFIRTISIIYGLNYGIKPVQRFFNRFGFGISIGIVSYLGLYLYISSKKQRQE